MKKPSVTVNCIAGRYASPGERIVEFSAGAINAGGLISLREIDGKLIVDVYGCDENVIVKHSAQEPTP